MRYSPVMPPWWGDTGAESERCREGPLVRTEVSARSLKIGPTMAQPDATGASGPPAVSASRAREVLQQLAEREKPIWAQLEFSSLRFRSRIVIKKDTVILNTPAWAQSKVTQGSHLRLEVPGPVSADIRVQVIASDPRSKGTAGLRVCTIPADLSKNLRDGTRFDVADHAQLSIEMNGHGYELLDLSRRGFRVRIPAAEMLPEIPVGQVNLQAKLHLGAKVWVQMEHVIPRNHQGRVVGCVFDVVDDGTSQNNLNALLDSLRQAVVNLGAAPAFAAGS